MPYFTPAKGLLDIPALWGHKLKPNMPLLDRPRIIPREPVQVIWASTPLDAMWFWNIHTTITPKRHQNKGQSPDLSVLPCGLSVWIPEQELCRNAATPLVLLPSNPQIL
jgi:hypothetical protein